MNSSSISNESSKNISILLVDRSERSFAQTNDLLKRLKSLHYTLDWASSFEDGIKCITSDKYNICLLDHAIDENGGLTFLKQSSELGTQCAVILLSDGLSIDGDMAALRAGATDYLQKARLLPGILHRAIRFAMQRRSSQGDNSQLKQKISKLLRTQAVSEIASGIALDLSNLIINIDRQFQLLNDQCSKDPEARSILKDGRAMCKQAYQLAANISVCTNPEVALNQKAPKVKERKQILVIDNNFNLLEVAKLYLEAGNLDCKCFSNPAYALEWFRQHANEVDGIILDCVCPPMSASECIKQLKNIKSQCPIALCSNKDNFDYRKLLELGAQRFFEKPAGYPSMVSWLVEVLGK